ncbi:MAG: GH32 C-terminal domain-containing protein, partial [Mucilaginibacter sp.]
NWRNAMTIPRELSLFEYDKKLYVKSMPVKELRTIEGKASDIHTSKTSESLPDQFLVRLNGKQSGRYSVTLSNVAGEKVVVGYDKARDEYFIDRTKSGKVDFTKNFSRIAYASRLSRTTSSEMMLLVDRSSVELFADGGRTVMTSICFPSKPYNHVDLYSVKSSQIIPLKGTW